MDGTKTFDLLTELLGSYLTQNLIFGILHAVVLVFVLMAMRDMWRETRGLKTWTESKGTIPPSETLALAFHGFIEEVNYLGQNGISVSISDYALRAEQAAEEIETRLNDRIHWFLLIGIAGTLLGLFGFGVDFGRSAAARPAPGGASATTSTTVSEQPLTASSRSEQDARQREDEKKKQELRFALDQVQKTPETLAAAMRRAFPVGFMGLLLTVFFQGWAGILEQRLHASLSEATNYALAFRAGRTISPLSAAARVASAVERLAEPLERVSEQFAAKLAETVDGQYEQMRQTATTFAETSGRLEAVVQGMSKAIASLPDTLKAAPKALKQVQELQTFQQQRLEELAKVFKTDLKGATELTNKVNDAIERFAAVPDAIGRAGAEAVREALRELGAEAVKEWRESLFESERGFSKRMSLRHEDLEGLFRRLTAGVDGLLEALGSNERGLVADLRTVSDRLLTTANNATDLMKRPVEGLVDEVGTKSRVLLQDLKLTAERAVGELGPKLEDLRSRAEVAAEQIRKVADGTEGAFVAPIRDVVLELRQGLEPVLLDLRKSLAASQGTLTAVTAEIAQGRGVMQGLRTDFEKTATGLQNSLVSSQQALAAAARTLTEPAARPAREPGRAVEEASAVPNAAIAQLQGTIAQLGVRIDRLVTALAPPAPTPAPKLGRWYRVRQFFSRTKAAQQGAHGSKK